MFEPMQTLHPLLEMYGQSHKNSTNKLIHWFCVPSIMFSLVGLLMAIPFPIEQTLIANWALVFFVFAWLYYLRLSLLMCLCFIGIGWLMLWGNFTLLASLQSNGNLALVSLLIFAVAWIGQFIGHKIEGAKPSFLQDLQFLLIGPAWLLHFIFNKMGIKY